MIHGHFETGGLAQAIRHRGGLGRQ
jgi:hypothetical protein